MWLCSMKALFIKTGGWPVSYSFPIPALFFPHLQIQSIANSAGPFFKICFAYDHFSSLLSSHAFLTESLNVFETFTIALGGQFSIEQSE